jgi:acyl dehydratase
MEYGPSQWFEITQDRIDAFAEVTDDRQWIHTDPQRAGNSRFGSTIAHGYLTLALLPMMMKMTVPQPDSGMTVNYGLNRLRFPAPLPVGSRIRSHFRIDSLDEIEGGFQQVCTAQVEREGGKKPVCVAEVVFRFYP